MKNKTKGAAQKDGGAVNAKDPAAAAKQIEKLGAAKGGDKKGDQSATHLDYEGSPRMGYTQNFGAARQGGYSKGAAKVNSIMKGAAQQGTIFNPTDRADLLSLSRKADQKAKQKLHSERGTAGIVDSLKIDQYNPAAAVNKYGKNFQGLHSQIRDLSPNTIKGLDTYIASGNVASDMQNIIDTEKKRTESPTTLKPKF